VRIRKLQFALAGIAAHVEHDLPLAVVGTCLRLGIQPDEVEPDCNRINSVLAEADASVRKLLSIDAADPAASTLQHLIDLWSLNAARDAAWKSLQVLWEVRRSHDAYTAASDVLDRSVELVSRALLTPVRARANTM